MAILASDGSNGFPTLAAADVNTSSVSLAGLAVAVQGQSNFLAHLEDVNGDGLEDLVVQIVDQDGTFAEGATMASVTGSLSNGTPIEGSDSICIVP